MADSGNKTQNTPISTSSYETALCVIPPQYLCHNVEKLRSLYDKGYGKWPPHINIMYPFVAPDSLGQAKERIQAAMSELECSPMHICLDRADYFTHRTNNTILLRDSRGFSEHPLSTIRSAILKALAQPSSPCNFHLTIGQSEDTTESSREFLLSKAKLLPRLDFPIHSLAILVRERGDGTANSINRMRLWSTIELPASEAGPTMSEYWLSSALEENDTSSGEAVHDSDQDAVSLSPSFSRAVQPGSTYRFDREHGRWIVHDATLEFSKASAVLSVSSYNVLVDSEHPPSRDRDPLLVNTILCREALADVLILQEVSDNFLTYLLANVEIREHYQFVTHGPPEQSDIGPLPSLRNVVVLSRWPFSWELVPFQRRHKGAVVAHFLSDGEDSGFVVAGVHLTCGLTDGSVTAKKVQVNNLKNFLTRKYPECPWIVAGDLNLTTSSYTIDAALKNKSIGYETARTLSSIETTISEVGLVDTWSLAHLEATDDTPSTDWEDLYEGEAGATFNPMTNVLAAATSGTSHNRPQRYDRILVRAQEGFSTRKFTHFGLPQYQDGMQVVPSDHAGIRASLELFVQKSSLPSNGNEMLKQTSISYKRAQESLSDPSVDLGSVLSKHGMSPAPEEVLRRREALALIKRVITGTPEDQSSVISDIPLVFVTVGSYALGVWTSSSDIDCLCIGSVSSKTFFKLARQRIMKSDQSRIRLLRKVEANSGTMLELSVNGINMDLQYCPAGRVVERWANIDQLDATDPVFSLPILSLRKLKPYRDISYIQRTLPSMPTFRLAYRAIKLWAVQHGLYSSRFGYLGGIHITLMLSCVCKRLVHDHGSVTAADLIQTFFHHYARFDWQKDMVFDALFHKKKPRYQRSAREPMVVLGFHAPNANVAHTSTSPGLRTLIKEFKSADERLSRLDSTWEEFFGMKTGTADSPGLMSEFQSSHDSYVKIDIQYWGRTLAKGKGLVSWVESRCLLLVVDIHKTFPHLDVRIWPARFTNTESSESYYYGCYLIGLSKTSESGSLVSKEERVSAKASLQKVLDRFSDQLHSDQKHYDATTSWIGVSLTKPEDNSHMVLDTRDWGDYSPDVDSDSEEEEEEEDFDDEALEPTAAMRRPQPRPAPSSTPVSTSKLRPASDVLNRLRWDPNLDPSEYIIGYEDRFLGAKETSLEKWKTEQTDEEFIPQHRILYFKKRGEEGGEIVWERSTRIDKIFGSGVNAES